MNTNNLHFLPNHILSLISNHLNINKIYEIRMRADKPIIINYGGENKYLTQKGISSEVEYAINSSSKDIFDTIMSAGEHSLYAFNDEIINGYITANGGVRIGVCGSAVVNNSKITSIKDFSSICIRLPHEIIGCSDKLYNYISKTGLCNILVISPPACGKTTLLRDLCRKIASSFVSKNILIVDERNELASSVGGKNMLDVGRNVDIMCNCSKEYAFENGVRSMNPDMIFTDEIYQVRDAEYIAEAIGSGVNVVASVHSANLHSFFNLNIGKLIKQMRIFDLYVVLSFSNGKSNIADIVGKDFEKIEL